MRILSIAVDSLCPDHLGCYGYCRSASPNIDALADAGVLDDTVIMVSADHGENLGELNVWGDQHGTTTWR
jgi:arylsulfatase A-like enzyme